VARLAVVATEDVGGIGGHGLLRSGQRVGHGYGSHSGDDESRKLHDERWKKLFVCLGFGGCTEDLEVASWMSRLFESVVRRDCGGGGVSLYMRGARVSGKVRLLGAWSERLGLEASARNVRLLGILRERIRTPRDVGFAWCRNNGSASSSEKRVICAEGDTVMTQWQ
jgi:hypothetical protein